jgi:outer membrane protein TolC
MSIQGAVKLALQRNLDLLIERVNPLIAHEQIYEATGAFDPLLAFSATYNRQERYVNTTIELAPGLAEDGLIVQKTFTPDSSLTGKLVTGTQYSLSLTAPVNQTTNPLRLFNEAYQPVLTFGLTQPLLRDFGVEVNLVRVKQAEKAERKAIFGIEAKMLTLIRDVERAYWTLFYAQERVKLAQGHLELAEDLVKRLTRMKNAGLATALDLLEARSAVETRRADLARARSEIQKAQAQLRLLIDPHPTIGTHIAVSDPPPDLGPPSDLEGEPAQTMIKRPEIREQELVIEALVLEELLAKNNTLWRLDAIGSVGYTGFAGSGLGPGVPSNQSLPSRLQGRNSYLQGFSDFFSPSDTNWSVGLRLQIPIGNNEAVSRLNQTRLRRQQEEFRLSLLKSQISVDVETAFQDVSAEWAQLIAEREAVSLSIEQLASWQKQLEAGLATVRKILEAQDNLATAQDKEIQALMNHAVAWSRLDAARALSFDRYRLVLQR